jgi:signal transduction histidine kinase
MSASINTNNKDEGEFSSLIRASKAILGYKSFKDSVNMISRECMSLIGARAGYVALLNKDDSENVIVFHAPGGDVNSVELAPSVSIMGLRAIAYNKGQAVYDNSSSASDHLRFLPIDKVRVKNVLFAPIIVEGKTVGLLGLEGKEGGFNEKDAMLALAFGEFAAIALVNSRNLEALRAGEERNRRLTEELDAKMKEQSLQYTQKQLWEEIGRVSSELAHDLRGPLQTITNSVFLIERKPNDLNVYLLKINGSLNQASTLLDSFREYYRGHEITVASGNVNKVLEKCLEDIQIPEAVRVVKKIDPSIPDTIFDAGKLRRVFWNLAKNGIEAMQSGGTLTLESLDAGDKIIIKISDTGTGIPENIMPKVFIAFGAKKRGGLGLGSAASKRVIDAHGGKISFETETGKGTVFTVVLPKKIL